MNNALHQIEGWLNGYVDAKAKLSVYITNKNHVI